MLSWEYPPKVIRPPERLPICPVPAEIIMKCMWTPATDKSEQAEYVHGVRVHRVNHLSWPMDFLEVTLATGTWCRRVPNSGTGWI